MATYNNREVTILQDVPNDPLHAERVQIAYADDTSNTQVVARSALELTPEEQDAYLKAERKKLDDKEAAIKEKAKAKAEADKKEVEFQKEKAEVAKKGLPASEWLKTATYNKGDQVTVSGVTYRSKSNGNSGNAPSDKSPFWTLIHTQKVSI